MTKAVLEIEETGHRHVKADIVIVELRPAASGAKRPFAGMSVLGGKADFPVARPDFSV